MVSVMLLAAAGPREGNHLLNSLQLRLLHLCRCVAAVLLGRFMVVGEPCVPLSHNVCWSLVLHMWTAV